MLLVRPVLSERTSESLAMFALPARAAVFCSVRNDISSLYAFTNPSSCVLASSALSVTSTSTVFVASFFDSVMITPGIALSTVLLADVIGMLLIVSAAFVADTAESAASSP